MDETDQAPATEAAEVADATQPVGPSAEALADAEDWLPDFLIPAWEFLSEYPLARSALIVLLAYIVAKILQFVIVRGIKRATVRTKSDLDDKAIEIVSAPLFSTLLLLGLVLATQSLPYSVELRSVIVRILLSIAVITLTSTAFRIGHLVLISLSRNTARFKLVEERTLPILEILWKVLAIAAAAYLLLALWGIDPTAWLASAGIVGIAVGFAAKDTLANLFSGFFIVADAPYKKGDYVNLDAGERGMVTHVGLRSTRLLTRDDIEITIPNAVIGNAKIINESGGPWEKMRVRIKVGAAYGSDVDQVCEVLQEVATSHDSVASTPAPRVRMRAFGASSLDFELLCWIDRPELRGLVSHQLYMDIYKAFDEAGIEIPYSKHDLYIKEMPEGSGGSGAVDGEA